MDIETIWAAAAMSRMREDSGAGAFGTTWLAAQGMLGTAHGTGVVTTAAATHGRGR